MTAKAKSRVVDVEFTDPVYGPHGLAHSRYQICERSSISHGLPAQTCRRLIEGFSWNPSLMRVPFVPVAVEPPRKACVCDRGLKVRKITEVPKLKNAFVTVNIVLHDCSK